MGYHATYGISLIRTKAVCDFSQERNVAYHLRCGVSCESGGRGGQAVRDRGIQPVLAERHRNLGTLCVSVCH